MRPALSMLAAAAAVLAGGTIWHLTDLPEAIGVYLILAGCSVAACVACCEIADRLPPLDPDDENNKD